MTTEAGSTELAGRLVDTADATGRVLTLPVFYACHHGRGLVRTIAAMPERLANAGRVAADPYEFFEIAGAALGIYRVDVDGEVYWTPSEE